LKCTLEDVFGFKVLLIVSKDGKKVNMPICQKIIEVYAKKMYIYGSFKLLPTSDLTLM
jgi:hypothetical protein